MSSRPDVVRAHYLQELDERSKKREKFGGDDNSSMYLTGIVFVVATLGFLWYQRQHKTTRR